jgi:hypothetical protein
MSGLLLRENIHPDHPRHPVIPGSEYKHCRNADEQQVCEGNTIDELSGQKINNDGLYGGESIAKRENAPVVSRLFVETVAAGFTNILHHRGLERKARAMEYLRFPAVRTSQLEDLPYLAMTDVLPHLSYLIDGVIACPNITDSRLNFSLMIEK